MCEVNQIVGGLLTKCIFPISVPLGLSVDFEPHLNCAAMACFLLKALRNDIRNSKYCNAKQGLMTNKAGMVGLHKLHSDPQQLVALYFLQF